MPWSGTSTGRRPTGRRPEAEPLVAEPVGARGRPIREGRGPLRPLRPTGGTGSVPMEGELSTAARLVGPEAPGRPSGVSRLRAPGT